MKRVFKYATGQTIPENAIYLYSCKNGNVEEDEDDTFPIAYKYVWHYFLVEIKNKINK